MERSYKGKLLLFGEYTVLNGAAALAIPLDKFSGKWSFSKTVDNQNLHKFAHFLKQFNKRQATQFDIVQFISDLNNGLFFESNIPMGYGVGSSGAVCAAVFDRYCISKKIIDDDLDKLKSIFAEMESFFHGISSGIDPLVSYLDKAIYYQKNHFIKAINVDSNDNFFLIDTKIERKTAPLVKIYLEKMNQDNFQIINQKLADLNGNSINAYLENNKSQLENYIHLISSIQFHHFKEMIPFAFQKQWEESLTDPKLSLKLCGAGGGGFIIGLRF